MAKTLDEMALRELLGVDAQPERPTTPYIANARYLSSLDGFNIKQPAIPAHVFLAERNRALEPATPTALMPLDLSRTVATPATPLPVAGVVSRRSSLPRSGPSTLTRS